MRIPRSQVASEFLISANDDALVTVKGEARILSGGVLRMKSAPQKGSPFNSIIEWKHGRTSMRSITKANDVCSPPFYECNAFGIHTTLPICFRDDIMAD